MILANKTTGVDQGDGTGGTPIVCCRRPQFSDLRKLDVYSLKLLLTLLDIVKTDLQCFGLFVANTCLPPEFPF